MRKYLRLLFLVFMSYFASISLAHSQADSSKAAKGQIKKLLTDGNKLNLKGIPDNLITTIKEGIVSQISNYFVEKAQKKEAESEEEFYTYLKNKLAPELAHKIYRSLLRDELKKKNADSKIINKADKTENEENGLYNAEKAVAKYLFKGTIILLSILDKKEYKYVRIFLEELQLLAVLPPSYPCIRNFCNGAFNQSKSAMQKLKEISLELWISCDERCKEIYDLNGEEDGKEKSDEEKTKKDFLNLPKKLLQLPRTALSNLISNGYKIKSLIPLNIPGSKKVKFAIATIAVASVTIPVLVYFDVSEYIPEVNVQDACNFIPNWLKGKK